MVPHGPARAGVRRKASGGDLPDKAKPRMGCKYLAKGGLGAICHEQI